jgi:hypothetical protein
MNKEYEEFVKTNTVKCGCCDKPLQSCPYWQAIRMITNPFPEESKYLDRT